MRELLGRIRGRKGLSLIVFAILLVGVVLQNLMPPAGVSDVDGRASIIDGDSLNVAGREVRLIGIDAPEGPQMCRRGGRNWDCGRASSRELRSLVGGSNVMCEGEKVDRHGRLLATCHVGTVNLNREMVLRGLALSYGRYRAEEGRARRAKSGLWGSEFKRPKEWRQERGIGR